VWRTELGTTLIVGFNSTTVLPAYFRNLCSQEYETAAPLASIATAPPLASIATALPLALKFRPCMAPQKRALCLSADKVGFLLRQWSVLSRLFRRLFLEALETAFQSGALEFFGELQPLAQASAFTAFLAPLRGAEWVVYCKPPFGGPQQALAYLGRYTH